MKFSALIPRLQITLLLLSLPAIVLLPLLLLEKEISLLPVILSTVALALLFFIFSYSLVSKLQSRLNVFSNMVLAVKEGDVSQRLRLFPDDSFSNLAKTINELIEHAQIQQQSNKSSQLLLQKIVTNIDVAIIAADEFGRITLANNKAQNLFIDPTSLVDQSTYTIGIHKLFKQSLEEPISFQFPNAKGRWQCFQEQFFDKGVMYQLYFITDVSHLLRMEELKSWKNLLRVLSHEINNSLTPIASISQSMQSSVKDDEDLSEGLQLIHQRAKSLESFIKSYRQFTHLPTPQIQQVDLYKLLNRCVLLLNDKRIELVSKQSYDITVDPALLEQVVINLLKNGLEACDPEMGQVVVNYGIEQQSLILSVTDNGKGIANMANLFVPLYSTKKQGSGIGLLVSRQIIEAHGGELSLDNNATSSGAIATISLPLH